MTSAPCSADKVLDFWFEEAGPERWWRKDREFDTVIAERFGGCHGQATRGELSWWRQTVSGRLAEIIVLDQFSRNIYRDDPRAFTWDSMALVLAQEMIFRSDHQSLDPVPRSFVYTPFMHSESPVIHQEAVRLFGDKGMENNLDFELQHKRIIDRFGRYPHRNHILGRESSADELDFLSRSGSSF